MFIRSPGEPSKKRLNDTKKGQSQDPTLVSDAVILDPLPRASGHRPGLKRDIPGPTEDTDPTVL